MTFATLPLRAILSGSLIGPLPALADACDVLGVLAHNELKTVNAQFSLRGPRTPHAPVVSQRAAYAPRRARSQAKVNIGPRVCLRFRAPQAGAVRGRLWLPG